MNSDTKVETSPTDKVMRKRITTSGYFRINEIIVPFIVIPEKEFRLFSTCPVSNRYVPCFHLADRNIISRSLLQNKGEIKSRCIATAEQRDEINKLLETLSKSITDNGNIMLLSKTETEKHELINISEVILLLLPSALFVRELTMKDIFKPKKFDFNKILSMRGGIMQLKIRSDDSYKIVPFVYYEDKILIKNTISINDGLNDMCQRNPESGICFKQELVTLSKEIIQIFAEFFQLILLYLNLYVKMSEEMIIINIKKWCDLYPDKFIKVCEYTSSFPRDWKDSINKFRCVYFCVFKFNGCKISNFLCICLVIII